jgi:nucleotide-binding universal stress UspA family protein
VIGTDSTREVEVRQQIVVGLDDSAPSRAALAWAATQAGATKAVLRAIHVLEWPNGLSRAGFPRPLDLMNVSADELEASYRHAITAIFDGVSPRADWLLQFASGDPGQVLVRQAAKADLLVVGTREHTGVRRLVNGSVSHYCLSHATCPVVAVPAVGAGAAEGHEGAIGDEAMMGTSVGVGEEHPSGHGPVVVGVDASAGSVAAARYAVLAADLRRADLVLVHAFPVSPALTGQGAAVLSAVRESAHRILDAVLAQLVIPSRLVVRTAAEPGEPAQVLAEKARRAAMLVVGQDDVTWTERIFPGAVASHAARLVTCPVIVVPRSWRPRHAAGSLPVVAAVEGTSDAEPVLALAYQEARRHGAPLVVLHAEPIGASSRQVDDAERGLGALLSRWQRERPEVPVATVLVAGDTDANLVRWSRSAALLVVGRPHHHGWGTWLHSVARSVMPHTHCPLAIAPAVAADLAPSREARATSV